jgi:hypothetical protein
MRPQEGTKPHDIRRSGVLAFESTAGTPAIFPPRIRMAPTKGAGTPVEVEAEIDGHTYKATVYWHGAIDLHQPSEGVEWRAKKTICVMSIRRLTLFLQTVESWAQSYFEDWGKE